MELKINEEFKGLIPPLSEEEFSTLEDNILRDGIREPISIWQDVIVDGHNRYEIAQKHNLSFQTKSYSFENEEKVKLWIIDNQFGRRNILPYTRSVLALKYKDILAKQAKERQEKGTNQYTPKEDRVVPNSAQGKTTVQIAQKAKVGKATIQQAEYIEANATPELKAKLHTDSKQSINNAYQTTYIEENATPELKEKLYAGTVSTNEAYKVLKQEEKRQAHQEKLAQSLKTPPVINGKFDVIYADPPWKYDFSETKSRDIENQYPTMTMAELKGMKIPAEDNAVLLMWATAPKLVEALDLVSAWGFNYVTNAVWDKQKIGMGYWFRGQHEFLLVATKGKFSPPEPENRFSSFYSEARTAHSKKPKFYYDMIEKMFPNKKYLELFCREKHSEAWAVWGNQI